MSITQSATTLVALQAEADQLVFDCIALGVTPDLFIQRALNSGAVTGNENNADDQVNR